MIISHSEVEAFLLCKRRHRYAFGEKIERRVMSESLQRGITGHSMMQAFWEDYAKHYNFDAGLSSLDARLASIISTTRDPSSLKQITDLHVRVVGFLNQFRDTFVNWEVISVEQVYQVPIENPWIDLKFAFTPDLVIKNRSTQRIEVVDWKFPYNFYNPTTINLMPQLPKYIGGLRKLGMSVRGGQYGFVRYRSLKESTPAQLYRLHPHKPSRVSIEDTWRDYMTAALEIANYKGATWDAWVQNATRVGNHLVCNSCAFKELCAAEKEGSDGVRIRQEAFQKSTYGYVEVME